MQVLALVSDAFGGHGGIALYNRNVLTALCNHPTRPHVVVLPRLVPKEPEPIPERLSFRLRARGGKGRYVAELLRVLLSPRRRFDLVLASHLRLLPLAELARVATRAKLVTFAYGYDAWTPPSRVTTYLFRRVDACVAIRELTLERLATWAPVDRARSHILENAIRLDQYGPGPRDPELVERYGLAGRRVILTLGRIDEPQAGVDEVLEALPRIVESVPHVTYLVAGSGTQLTRLKSKARELGVADRVVFAGAVCDQEKTAHYRLADAFALPGSHADFDRYPLRFVFLEAMACGLPVVASQPEELVGAAASPIPNIYVDPAKPRDILRGLLEALHRGPGEVPSELGRYDFAEFQTRLHHIVDHVMSRGRGHEPRRDPHVSVGANC